MDFEEFENSWAKLNKWFRPNLKDDQIELYFEEIQHFPAEAFRDLTKGYVKSRRPIKSNLPTIDDYLIDFRTWLKDHPNFVTQDWEKKDCIDCGGTGVLTFRRFEENYTQRGYWVYYAALCATCADSDNFKGNYGTRRGKLIISRDRILSLGWEIWPKDYPEDRNNFPVFKSKQDIEDLASDIGERIPF